MAVLDYRITDPIMLFFAVFQVRTNNEGLHLVSVINSFKHTVRFKS